MPKDLLLLLLSLAVGPVLIGVGVYFFVYIF